MNVEPVALNSDEIYDILKKRLFDTFPSNGSADVNEVAVGYKESVFRAGKSGLTSYSPEKLKILVGTDAASEGLNLQTLSTLINVDLPWNPTRLEQRKGRIQRIGQLADTILTYNMRYKDSVE